MRVTGKNARIAAQPRKRGNELRLRKAGRRSGSVWQEAERLMLERNSCAPHAATKAGRVYRNGTPCNDAAPNTRRRAGHCHGCRRKSARRQRLLRESSSVSVVV